MKNKTAWIVAAIFLTEAVILTILWCCGFKITYSPDLESGWDAISACAGWASVIASFVAILVAIRIPIVIAKQQNDISLFEKRSSFYFDFCRCISFCEGLDTVENYGGARMIFYTMFSNESVNCEIDEVDKRVTPLQMRIASDLFIGNYLFNFDVDKYLDPVVKGIVEILSAKTDKEFFECRKKLKKDGAEAKLQLTSKFEQALKLTK